MKLAIAFFKSILIWMLVFFVWVLFYMVMGTLFTHIPLSAMWIATFYTVEGGILGVMYLITGAVLATSAATLVYTEAEDNAV